MPNESLNAHRPQVLVVGCYLRAQAFSFEELSNIVVEAEPGKRLPCTTKTFVHVLHLMIFFPACCADHLRSGQSITAARAGLLPWILGTECYKEVVEILQNAICFDINIDVMYRRLIAPSVRQRPVRGEITSGCISGSILV
jgi:hypothetical protein